MLATCENGIRWLSVGGMSSENREDFFNVSMMLTIFPTFPSGFVGGYEKFPSHKNHHEIKLMRKFLPQLQMENVICCRNDS